MNTRSTAAAAALVLAAITLTGCGSSQHRSRTTTAGCTTQQLTVSLGPKLPGMTGEHSDQFEIRNVGSTPCRLSGYPTSISLLAGTRTLPFRYARGGGPYIPKMTPRPVTLSAGGGANFAVAKYRCDAGVLASATSIRFQLPVVQGTSTVALPRPYAEGLNYCKKFKPGGPPDPGNTVVSSPVEPGRSAKL